ncbi:hypothetical protein FRC08_005699 [Ceratobasidium sp. 394]|nr:hypothetical protein FRC08_005699 [Ceratobasidium sp. 394]
MTRDWIPLWLKHLFHKPRPPMTASPNRYIFPSPDRDEIYIPKVHTLRDDILDDGAAVAHVGNIYVERMTFYKRQVHAQHEFLAFHVRDKTDSSRENVLILDRVPDSGLFTPPRVGDVAQGGPAPRPARRRVISWPSFPHSQPLSSMSPSSRPREADDRFTISLSNDPNALFDRRGLQGAEPELSYSVEHRDLTIEKIVVLACSVTAHQRNYTLNEHQCYWYAKSVWTIACDLAGIDSSNERPTNIGTNTAFVVPYTPGVPLQSTPEILRPIYEKDWKDFCEEVRLRQARGPAARIEEANERAQRAETAQVAAEARARIEAEGKAAAEAKARMEAEGKAAAKARAQKEAEARAVAERQTKAVEIELETLRRRVEHTELSGK